MMAANNIEINSLEEFNEWLDKLKAFAEANWDRKDVCDILIEHNPILLPKIDGQDWDEWREGERGIMLCMTTKAPEIKRDGAK